MRERVVLSMTKGGWRYRLYSKRWHLLAPSSRLFTLKRTAIRAARAEHPHAELIVED